MNKKRGEFKIKKEFSLILFIFVCLSVLITNSASGLIKENCKTPGDEDGNGLADCIDTAACSDFYYCSRERLSDRHENTHNLGTLISILLIKK